MLRQYYIDKINEEKRREDIEKGIIKREFILKEHKKTGEDNVLKSTRPLPESEIQKLPDDTLKTFVDKVLSNRAIGKLIYNSNADSEIKILQKGNKTLRNPQIHSKKKRKMDSKALVERRKRNDVISNMQIEFKNFTKDKDLQKNKLEKEVAKKRQRLASQRDIENKQINDFYFNRREENFRQTFDNICHRLEEKKLDKLPDVELNKFNVFSRLYHNSVFIDNSAENDRKKVEYQEKLKNMENNKQPKIPFLNAKNAITTSGGKEFTAKITPYEIGKCFLSYSGGPESLGRKLEEQSTDLKNKLLESKYENGETLLHHAIKSNIRQMIDYLLIKKVDINSQNKVGDTPLHIAMQEDNLEITKLLIEKKANIFIANYSGQTPLDFASVVI